ncbi:MAG TPA: two-component regulator propeller domain-containing protein [Ideonella sp.]|uniref:sensor histidine kinase n=1 Tax=Ideonella sp. TaxID=1929293 RepID=UPI002B9652AD|nr:two-component regulator propeller domain-containing protein [Ideonella sp.]HSI50575.1 two-component regulator propeller domain-containing protein [Ideonella sp.]
MAWQWMMLAAALLAGLPGRVLALPAMLDLAQFHHSAWLTRDGAPSEVNSLAQTADGYLWLGSATGLFRFDGVRFERFAAGSGQALVSQSVASLLASRDGGLWVGYRYGGLSHWKDGRLRHVGAAQGLPTGTVTGLAQQADGSLWVATAHGLARQQGERWLTLGAAQGLPDLPFYAVMVDGSDGVWALADDAGHCLPRGAARFARCGDSQGHGQLALGPQGAVWATNGTRGVWPLTAAPLAPGQPPALSPSLPARVAVEPGPGDLSTLMFDRDGTLWLGARSGLARVVAPQQMPSGGYLGLPDAEAAQWFKPSQGLSGELVMSMLEDREGTVWVATTGGLDRFRRNKLTRVLLPPQSLWFSLAAGEGGKVWAGSVTGPSALLLPTGGTSPGFVRQPTLGPRITAAYRARNGEVWLGGATGLWRARGSRVEPVPLPPAAAGNPLQAIGEDAQGRLWLSVMREGMFRRESGNDAKASAGAERWTRQPLPAGVDFVYPLAMGLDREGAQWLAFNANHLVRLSPGEPRQARHFTEADGLSLGSPLALDGSGERLWLAGEQGVAWFDGQRFHALQVAGEALMGVSGLVLGGDGSLWLNSATGILHIAPAELAAALQQPAHAVTFERFDYHDGLDGAPSQLRPIPSAVKGSDGRLWFATTNSVVWLDPRRIARNPLPPPVHLQALVADGQAQPLKEGLQLAVGTRSLEIHYAALSLSMPERVHFRYRLQGVDSDWQDGGTRRAAYYTNLGPGHYRFELLAANEDGVWSPQGAALSLAILPAFYQTWWFPLMCVPVVLGLLAWGFRLRVRSLTRRLNERHQARLLERERIARELHDTLLQSVQGLLLRFQSAADRLPDETRERAGLTRALDLAEQVLVEGRDRVGALRSPGEPGPALDQRLQALGEQLAQEHGVAFELQRSGVPVQLAPAEQEELWLIAREALLNAFNHAAAGRVQLTLAQGAGKLLLQVQDDGRGLPPEWLAAGARPGHWGLAGQRERAARLGARLSLQSAPGQGTTLRLEWQRRSAGPWQHLRRWWRAAGNGPPRSGDTADF